MVQADFILLEVNIYVPRNAQLESRSHLALSRSPPVFRGQVMPRNPLCSIAAVLVVVLLNVLPATSQSGLATLQGVVADPTGAAIPGASVSVREAQTGLTHDVKTNE